MEGGRLALDEYRVGGKREGKNSSRTGYHEGVQFP